jgi:putative flippase GtrA
MRVSVRLVDKTLARFIIVGFVNTGIGAALMFCLYNLFGWSYWAASAANYTVGSIASFF